MRYLIFKKQFNLAKVIRHYGSDWLYVAKLNDWFLFDKEIIFIQHISMFKYEQIIFI